MKDEMNRTPIIEFVGLRPKMYSIPSEEKKHEKVERKKYVVKRKQA